MSSAIKTVGLLSFIAGFVCCVHFYPKQTGWAVLGIALTITAVFTWMAFEEGR